MVERSLDVAFELPKITIKLEVWSSDFTNFQLENKIIKTTLQNTVLDIKEVIGDRSFLQGGRLNSNGLRLLYRNQEYADNVKLCEFLTQEHDNIRIRIEPIIDKLGAKEPRPCFLNVNLKFSNGKKLSLRESLQTTVRSLKYTIVDNLKLNGLHDITTLEYYTGQELQHLDDLTIGKILHLDTPPPYDLNIYVRLHDDFVVRLSSPNQEVLRLNKMIVSLDTTISNIKRFMIDQYIGPHDIGLPQIKLIYSGRVLENESKLSQLINGDSSVHTLITLHFVINEPEPKKKSNGFWSDLRNGNSLFEFLPLEPNPNFEADLERDRRLRERLAGNIVDDDDEIDPMEGNTSVLREPGPELQPIQQPIQEPIHHDPIHPLAQFQPPEIVEERSINNHNTITNEPPFVPDMEFTGESLDWALVDGEKVLMDQLDTSYTIYEITANTVNGPKTIQLSSSQVIINDESHRCPYLMLSPSGFAKLKSLELDQPIQPPKILVDNYPRWSDTEFISPSLTTDTPTPMTRDTTPAVPNIASSQTVPITTQFNNNNNNNNNNNDQEAIPPHQGANNLFTNIRRLSAQINTRSFTTFLRILGSLGFRMLKIVVFHSLVITPVDNTSHRMVLMFLLGIYMYTNQSLRTDLNELQQFFSLSTREWIHRNIVVPEEQVRNFFYSGSDSLMNSIMNMLPGRSRRGRETLMGKIDRILRNIIVCILLFFATFFPQLNRQFNEINARMVEADEVWTDLPEIPPQPEPQPPAETEENIDEEHELIRDQDDNATGVQRHHEN